jgi:glyoxylase-like metal-dependent hydrolase (beta-lactamase superfamily II)
MVLKNLLTGGKVKEMKIKLIDTGYCESFENIAIQGGAYKKIKYPSLVGILKHPTKGIILFDTGYSERIFEVTKRFPARIYSWILPPTLLPNQSVKSQLKTMGIAPEEVNYIIISHFHADHTCGLKDFHKATFVYSTTALEHLISLTSKIKATKEAVLWDLIPKDLEQRSWLYQNDATVLSFKDKHLGRSYDLFGDGSVLLNDLPGHLTGQIGALITTNKEKYFLIADACWLSKSYRQNILPSSISRLIISDFKAFKSTLKKIHYYHKANPAVHIIPTHCEKTVQHYVTKTEDF